MTILKPLFRLKKYLIQYKRQLIIGFVFINLSNVFASIIPKLLQRIIDAIAAGISLQRLALYAIALFVLSLLASAIRFLMRKTIVSVSRQVDYQLRNDYFSHLQKMSLQFFVKNRTGDLMARATNDINAVSLTIGMGAMFMVSNSITFVLVFILMSSTNLKLTLLALTPFPLILIIIYLSFGYFYKIYENVQTQFGYISNKVQENIGGIRVIQAYVQEENEVNQFSDLNRAYLQENLKLARSRGLTWASMDVLFGLSFVILLWFGGKAVIVGQMSIGDLVAFTVWLGMLSWPIISIGWVLNLIQRASASMDRIHEVMDTVPQVQDTHLTDHSLKSIQGEIEFKNVSFAYDEKLVLKNINLKIQPGQTIAIIGPTGSGKTTLVNLLPRLIEPIAGQILIDGTDIRRLPLKVLRRHIGFVPQETFLFSETIGENIAFGMEEVRDHEIEWAASVSTIRDDLENFPERYETLIGERGITLSGGQKQRTAISRALLRKPKILILDDALSSVDTYTEEKILQSLQQSYYHQTNIFISHRISTVRHADLILVLNNGEIIEQGNHHELIKHKGFYAQLYQKQLLEKALDEL
ncbi:MAG: ABC transporter ATP-binding protein/permease [candidate division KSB1 bacterium]|nr:ABC transporter ATP-binding protein/permease [candidate division KSB1 bacterium]MDZ7342636.1 ABC transporter ATP-binding protein/permease [candidate division KSB1 bacterium]